MISRNGDSNPRRYADWADSLETGPVVIGDWNGDGLADIGSSSTRSTFRWGMAGRDRSSWRARLPENSFEFRRWDVNDPVAAGIYVDNFAAHTDEAGDEQPLNERPVQPGSGPVSFAMDSAVTPEIPEDFATVRAASGSSQAPVVLEEDDDDEVDAPSNESTSALDDFVSGEQRLVRTSRFAEIVDFGFIRHELICPRAPVDEDLRLAGSLWHFCVAFCGLANSSTRIILATSVRSCSNRPGLRRRHDPDDRGHVQSLMRLNAFSCMDA